MKKSDALKAAIATVDVFAVGSMNPDDYCEFDRLNQSLIQHYIQCEGELESNIRRNERQDCWNEINAQIKQGPLSGDGCDKQAERNGMVMASNILALKLHG